VAPERQVRLDAGLERGQAQLVDPDQLRPGVGLLVAGGADVGQRRAAPQPQGLAQQPGGPLRVGLGERLPPSIVSRWNSSRSSWSGLTSIM